jgi:hypothetical protein
MRDSGGHGHNEGEAGNPNHDPKTGRFGSGGGGANDVYRAVRGPAAEKPGTAGNRVAFAERSKLKAAATGDHQQAQTPNAGHGYPIVAHAGTKSVGTHTGVRLTKAAQENVAKGEDIDARHLPLSASAHAQRLALRRIRNIPAGR